MHILELIVGFNLYYSHYTGHSTIPHTAIESVHIAMVSVVTLQGT